MAQGGSLGGSAKPMPSPGGFNTPAGFVRQPMPMQQVSAPPGGGGKGGGGPSMPNQMQMISAPGPSGGGKGGVA